jgi:hypothetical protein
MRSATDFRGVSKGALRPLGRGSSTSELLAVFPPLFGKKRQANGILPIKLKAESLRAIFIPSQSSALSSRLPSLRACSTTAGTSISGRIS